MLKGIKKVKNNEDGNNAAKEKQEAAQKPLEIDEELIQLSKEAMQLFLNGQ